MENFVFTSLRTEGMEAVMELNNVELLNQYCVAVVQADTALSLMSLNHVGKSLSAIEAVKNLIFDKTCDLTEHMVDESHTRMSYDPSASYEEHPLVDALDLVIDNLEEVACALRVLECELEDELADESFDD